MSSVNLPFPFSGGGGSSLFGSSLQPSLGSVIGGGFGAASGFFPTSSTTTSSGTSSGTLSGAGQQTLTGQGQDFLNQLLQLYGQYSQGTNLAGYQAQQANQINQNAGLQSNQLNQELAARGLATSPVSASLQAGLQQGRIGQLNTLNQQIPLLQQQLQQQALGTGAGIFSQIPRGYTQNQQQNQQFNQTQKTTSGGGIGGLLSGIGSLAGLFSDERLKKNMKPMKGEESIKLLSKLQPISFKWKENSEPGHSFSAQKVEKVLPKSVVKDDQGFRRLDIVQVIPALVSAVNELSRRAA